MKTFEKIILPVGILAVLIIVFLAVFDIARNWRYESDLGKSDYTVPFQKPQIGVVAWNKQAPKPVQNKPLQLQEAHWAGMEVIPISTELIKKLNLPPGVQGVLIDEVTLASAASGFMAGDIVLEVNKRPTRSIREFREHTIGVRDRKAVNITVDRNRELKNLVLRADILGIAQVETAPMVPAGSIAPHPYRGPCTDCHSIGNTGQLNPDPGGIILPPPPIPLGAKPPHRNMGSDCFSCHGLIRTR